MARWSILFLALAACKGDDGEDTDPVADTDTDGGGDTDTDVEPACTALVDGTYTAAGSCFGMAMTVGLTFDADTCSFVLDDWSMNHGNSPTGGTVDGDTVTLSGGDFDGCTGEIDGGLISGTCDGGCAWELEL
jgi:hypothetical protein